MGNRDYESLVIIIIIFISATLGNTFLPLLTGSSNYLYFIKPIFWLALSYYIWRMPRTRFKGKLRLYSFIIIWSAICGILYMSIFFAGGFLDGIGTSPYTRKITGIAANVLGFGSVTVMMEWVRSYVINKVKKKYIILFGIATVLVFSLYGINLRILFNLRTWPSVVQYVGEYVLPEIAENTFLTYLVYISGAYPAMIYSALTSVPIWITPVLPNLEWITRAFIGTLSPVIFLVIIRQVYRKQTREIKIREQKREKPQAWIATSIFAILVIWFAVGVFPVFPTVILTGSMEPSLKPGDVAIMKKCDGKNLAVGSVIQYWTGEYYIIHRIIAIDNTSGKYQTKGDNNSVPDSRLVGPEQVRGKLIAAIPKVGMLNILIRTKSRIRESEVEF
jgi:signal peptidase